MLLPLSCMRRSILFFYNSPILTAEVQPSRSTLHLLHPRGPHRISNFCIPVPVSPPPSFLQAPFSPFWFFPSLVIRFFCVVRTTELSPPDFSFCPVKLPSSIGKTHFGNAGSFRVALSSGLPPRRKRQIFFLYDPFLLIWFPVVLSFWVLDHFCKPQMRVRSLVWCLCRPLHFVPPSLLRLNLPFLPEGWWSFF